jgi:phosphoglycerol transferase MdoB-like AlkP superfamily enzyme
MFSLFSSWYPSSLRLDFIKRYDDVHKELMLPGIARSANNAGYRTAFFLPNSPDNFEHQRNRFEALGFEQAFYPSAELVSQFSKSNPEAKNCGDEFCLRTKVKDLAMLSLFKQELLKSLKKGERFCFTFNPQFGHGPWLATEKEEQSKPMDDSVGAEEISSIAHRRELMLEEQDKWLGEIISIIESHNRLEKTLIVIVGDHGIRTKTEDAEFRGGTIDHLSFHVPLLIYAPGVLSKKEVISWVTSHIDVAPTLLDLLGLDTHRQMEQGLPMWDQRIPGRTVFLFARSYLGADGFYNNNAIHMYRGLSEEVYVRENTDLFRFNNDDLISSSSPQHQAVKDKIATLVALQESWVKFMIPENYHQTFK